MGISPSPPFSSSSRSRAGAGIAKPNATFAYETTMHKVRSIRVPVATDFVMLDTTEVNGIVTVDCQNNSPYVKRVGSKFEVIGLAEKNL
jgi:hypothetical protein